VQKQELRHEEGVMMTGGGREKDERCWDLDIMALRAADIA